MDQNISFEIDSHAIATVQGLSIEANFSEMEEALTAMMEPYRKFVVTDMGAAKSARAYVNKVKKSIDDSRKMVKKLYSAPLTSFEERCKALTAICDEASGAIDAQIKAEEQKEKDLRIAALRRYFDTSTHGIEDYIDFETIFNPKWENKSYGMEKAQDDIDRAINQTRNNVDAIMAMHSPYETTLLLVLRDTGDMGKVLMKKAACERIDERKAEKTEERDKAAVDAIGTEEPEEIKPVPAAEKLYNFTLTFTATREQAFLINDFFKQNNIRFRKVKGEGE